MTFVSLHVGINDFPGTGLDLSGCVNDATDTAEAARARGYSARTLLNQEATREAILEGIRVGLQQAGPKGRFLFSISSHGTYVPVSGDPNEPDNKNEAICCWDFQSAGLILDDDLYRVFQSRPSTARVFLMIDTCHSGTMSRAIMDLPYPREEIAARYLPPQMIDPEVLRAVAVRASGSAPSVPVPMLAACAPHEVSWDTSFGGRPNGAFTYTALKALREANPGSLWSWHREIRKTLGPESRTPQTPQLDASLWQKTWKPLA